MDFAQPLGPVVTVVFVPDCRSASVRNRTLPEKPALPPAVFRARRIESSALRSEITRRPLPVVVTVQPPAVVCVVVYDHCFVIVPLSEARKLASETPEAARAWTAASAAAITTRATLSPIRRASSPFRRGTFRGSDPLNTLRAEIGPRYLEEM